MVYRFLYFVSLFLWVLVLPLICLASMILSIPVLSLVRYPYCLARQPPVYKRVIVAGVHSPISPRLRAKGRTVILRRHGVTLTRVKVRGKFTWVGWASYRPPQTPLITPTVPGLKPLFLLYLVLLSSHLPAHPFLLY